MNLVKIISVHLSNSSTIVCVCVSVKNSELSECQPAESDDLKSISASLRFRVTDDGMVGRKDSAVGPSTTQTLHPEQQSTSRLFFVITQPFDAGALNMSYIYTFIHRYTRGNPHQCP